MIIINIDNKFEDLLLIKTKLIFFFLVGVIIKY